jgi:unsaturated rhamnogalacturonyl hydrolase
MKPQGTIAFLILLLLPLLYFSSCNTSGTKKNSYFETDYEKFAIELAEGVMFRYDSLITYNDPSKIKWQYDIAFLGMAIDKLGYLDYRYSKYYEEFINYFVNDDGTMKIYKQSDYNLDHINPAKGLITLYKRTGEEKYRKAIDLFIDHLNMQPRTPEGGFWHKKIYPQQMWLDGIYMSAPFMAQYAREFNDPDWFSEVFNQITLIYSKTLNPENGLLYHAWDASKSQAWCNPETGQSKEHWGRAMGWFTMALIDVLDYYPEKQPGRDSIITILQSTCESISRVMDPEKQLWYQVLDKGHLDSNYLEASASMMFIYTFARGVNKGYLPEKYLQLAEKSYDAALETFIRTGEDGYPVLVNTVGGCGLGGNPYRDGSYEYYITEIRVDNDPKGMAPFILASIELHH